MKKTIKKMEKQNKLGAYYERLNKQQSAEFILMMTDGLLICVPTLYRWLHDGVPNRAAEIAIDYIMTNNGYEPIFGKKSETE